MRGAVRLGRVEEELRAHRERTRAAIARSEARYRALVEASAQIVWTTDAEGKAADIPSWRAVTGQTEEEVHGSGWLDALHEDDRERVLRDWEQALAARRPYGNEFRLRQRDGTFRWMRSRGVPVLGEQGEVREWVGTVVDIEEEKRAEEAQREDASLAETLQRIGGTLTSELDLERITQTVTDAATELTTARFGAFFYNVVDKAGARLTLYTLSGAPREAFEGFGHPRPTPVFAPTFHGTAIVRSDDITQDPRYGQMPPHHGMPPGHLPVRSYLAVPVISRRGEVIGGLFFRHEDVGVFTRSHERLATGIAAWARWRWTRTALRGKRPRARMREANSESRSRHSPRVRPAHRWRMTVLSRNPGRQARRANLTILKHPCSL